MGAIEQTMGAERRNTTTVMVEGFLEEVTQSLNLNGERMGRI